MTEDPTDAELVDAALAGEAASLGLLLERHRAGMRAVAVAVLGFGPAAEDAVQDAMLTAVRRLHDLRDPAAVGAWLRAIVRNACRMQLRAARPAQPLVRDVPYEETAEAVLDRHALRDWVWHAIGHLSEPLQLVVLLRHFGPERSYAQIAEICGIPIGTVRSRLNEARRLLAAELLAAAEAAHDDVGALTRRRREGLSELLAASVQGTHEPVVADLANDRMAMDGWWGHVPDGRDLLVRILGWDAEDGVRERVVEVCASKDFTIMECELINPAWDPTHCPPAVLWLVRMRGERIAGIRLCHPVQT